VSFENNNKLNLVYYLSNRASYYRSKPVLNLMKVMADINLKIILTSSLTRNDYAEVKNEITDNYGSVISIPFNGYDGSLYSMAYYSGELAKKTSKLLNDITCDMAICYADRFELLPFAQSCAYMKIPLAQIQAGEDSGNIDQKVRHAVSHLADLRFASHAQAQMRLQSMGLESINTGCPSIDVIKKLDLKKSNGNYIMCIFHPHTRENHSADLQAKIILETIDKFTQETGIECYFFAANNDPGHKLIEQQYRNNKNIKVIINLAESSYLRLLAGAKCIVGNSSSGLREASYLGVPAVNIGSRQENRVRAENVIQSDFNGIYANIVKAIGMKPEPSNLFGDGNAAKRIVEEIRSWINQRKS